MSVDPGGRAISKEPLPASGHYAAGFTYQVNGNGPIAPIGEQFWWHDAASRHLGFIVNTGGKLPKLYFFRDFRDTEPTVRNPQCPAPAVEDIHDAGSLQKGWNKAPNALHPLSVLTALTPPARSSRRVRKPHGFLFGSHRLFHGSRWLPI